jgi:hypothetical protein
MKICSVSDCETKSRAAGFCNAHYKKNKIYGDPLGGKPGLEERFWAKVDQSGECWNWIASTYPNGYGQFGMDGSMRCAHRVAYRLAVGPIPEGHHIDHICHNKLCCNPEHLRPVTNKQNMENRSGPTKRSVSGVLGVSWSPTCGGRWHARVRHNKRDNHVGYFSSLEDAEAAVLAKRLELFTHNDLDRIAA